MTDNAVFVELMENYMDSQSRNQFWSPSRTRKSAYCQPTWEFWFEGTLSHRGVTSSMKSPVTWGSLLGFPDDPWEYSQAFWGALQQLEALGIDGASRKRLLGPSTVRWEYTHPNGGMSRNIQADTLEAIVHIASVSPNVTEMTAAVGQAALSSLIQEAIGKADSFYNHVDMKGVPKYLGVNYTPYEKDGEREYLSRLDVVGTMEDIGAHSSLCSAVAEASSADRLNIEFRGEFEQTTGPIRWAWLVYALFCGTSGASREPVRILASLTSQDIIMIQEVLRRNHPQPLLEQNLHRPPEYGFVDIHDGAQLFGRNGIRLEITRGVRYRALYCPDTTDGSVDVVVPGFGMCTTKIEDEVNFVKDTVCPILPFGQLKSITSLTLDLFPFESETVLIQLLSLIGAELDWGRTSQTLT
ncbi:hypothetical protein PHYSODRAFT_307271 [Phytophthora sojae]|uniref:Uncharacterized protein n=1 Tax=Phytophthora sojae (strain P6497) TaxID=1094619 RepID=G5ADM8_PHYSP|nr:hypothetical protein PHYSODRAFT_307271 [Phytophthora sojae]EGZ06281.1 hypothetical protein PHYSODRAFT_307271 [Phytophthora sojae]|eukprot:XP_009538178.1 hypothetical protein PHYSODRAFT_307271 [Phytophthora sojae]